MITAVFCSLTAMCLLRISTLLRDWPTWETDDAAWREHGQELSSLAALCGVFAALAVGQSLEFAAAGAVGGAIAVIVYIVVSRWELRHCRWFWSFIAFVVCIHAIAVALIPWPTAYEPSKADAIFVIIDFLVVLGLLALLERRMRRGATQPIA